jgi:hypothetical protein
LLQEIHTLLQKQALVRVMPQDLLKPAFYSLLFLVPKWNGGFRPVIDVSRLNRFVDCPHFKMETVRTIQQAVRPGDWSFSIDLSDAYLHVPIHPSSRRFLRIALSTSEVYEFRVLPFGLNTAPRVFTRVATAVAAHLRRRGIRIHVYLDDWLVLDQNRLSLEERIPEILLFVRSLGFLVNEKKSRLYPSQRFEHLGLLFDTSAQMIRPADHLVEKAILAGSATDLLVNLTPRRLMQVIGLLNALADFVPLGRLRLRPIQFWLRNRWSQKDKDLDGFLVATQTLSQALAQWTDSDWLLQGIPLVRAKPSCVLFTDASTWGWGASLGDTRISGIWTPSERLAHINVLEMRAVLLAFKALRDLVRKQSVLLLTDNTVCVCYLRKQGGLRSPVLCDLTWEIYLFLHSLEVDLQVRHIPSKLNVMADALSRRRPLLTEWTLNMRVFSRVQSIVPALSVDLFATRLNRQLPLFVSPFPDQEALAADALSFPWDFQGLLYAFPPAALLPAVLRKIREEQIPLILLIAPCWPRQAWFADLLERVVVNPLRLPQLPDLLTQGLWIHPVPAMWNLHAWLLSGTRFPHQVSRHRWLSEWHKLAEPPLTSFTMRSGSVLQIGVAQGRSILSVPMALF